MGLNHLPVDKDAVLLWTEACEKELSFLFDDDVVLFADTDREFVTLGEAEGNHAKVLHRRLSIDENCQVAHELIEREINPVLFIDADHEAELHIRCWGLNWGQAFDFPILQL